MRAGAMRSLVQVYRRSETRGTLGSTPTVWAAVPNGRVWAAVLSPTERMRNYGAGQVNDGNTVLEVRAFTPVEPRDGMEIIAGPEKGSRWVVEGVDDSTPGLRRVQLVAHEAVFA